MELFDANSFATRATSEFPAEALKQAAVAGNVRMSSYLSNRLDLRGKTILSFGETPEKHCECAISVYRKDDGCWQLGLHVSDVDEYVCEGSPLDEEAKKRCGTVRNGFAEIEMLPPVIVNDVCDLQVGKDRLAISAFMDISSDGELESISFEESVIRVAEKCLYDEIEHLGITNDKSSVYALHEKYSPYMNIILDMYELAAIFCSKRRDRGGLDCTVFRRNFERKDNGTLGFSYDQEPDSRAMVRELGYFAAEAVGRYMFERNLPCIYIGQEALDVAALDFLATVVGTANNSAEGHLRMSEIADCAKGSPFYGFVCTAIRRALPCSSFSDKPIFNSAGATDHLVSFIHPATKYSSLLTLRMIKQGILASGDVKNLNLNKYRQIASSAAIQATEAEAAVCGVKKRYFISAAEEYVENNLESLHKGFPFRVHENGSVSVMLICGLIASVPSEYARDCDFVIGAAYDFEIIGKTDDKPIAYVKLHK